MSQTLIALSADLRQLQEAGYKIRVVQGAGGTLLVMDEVPYVTPGRQVARGSLVAPLELNADVTINPVPSHQTWFVGEHPCDVNGTPIAGITHGSTRQDFGGGIVVQHSFSAKRVGGHAYADNYVKFVQYATILTAPAQELEPGITAMVHHPIVDEAVDSVFHYADTATSRARFGAIAQKLAGHRIAIVGLGGTGSYVLDMLAKTPVAEIHLYDGDSFLQHNAFRSPGAPALSELTKPFKVDYLAGIYSRMRKLIVPHPVFVNDEIASEIATYDFVFICVDRGPARKTVADALIAAVRPFIDVGLNASELPEAAMLSALCRTTLVTPAKHDHFYDRATTGVAPGDDVYASNIQLAELNALNASMAVIRWKQYVGFYLTQDPAQHLVYTVQRNGVARSDPP